LKPAIVAGFSIFDKVLGKGLILKIFLRVQFKIKLLQINISCKITFILLESRVINNTSLNAINSINV